MSLPQLVHAVRETVIKRDRILRMPEVERATGIGKSTIYALMARKEFPQCVRITARCVGWPESAVLSWIQEKITESGTGSASASGKPSASLVQVSTETRGGAA